MEELLRLLEKINVQLILKENALQEVVNVAKKLVSAGLVCVVAQEGEREIACEIKKRLLEQAYNVDYKELPSTAEISLFSLNNFLDLSEETRLIFAVGEVAELAKIVAYRLNIEWVFVATNAMLEDAVKSNVILYKNGKQTNYQAIKPKVVICPLELILYQKNELTGATFGLLFSKYIEIFDFYYSSLVFGKRYNRKLIVKIEQKIDEFFELDFGENFRGKIKEMMILNLKISALQEIENCFIFNKDIYMLSSICKKYYGRTLGENAFLVAYCLFLIYNSYLTGKDTVMCLPPNKIEDLEQLSKLIKEDLFEMIANISVCSMPFQQKKFVFLEYKNDLKKYFNKKMRSLSKIAQNFKRNYSDVGYFLQECLTSDEIIGLINMASAMVSENMMLAQIKEEGLLDFKCCNE
ncbi:MAG: iron-containing alcohol dehydrogenase [Clostridia bacterium]